MEKLFGIPMDTLAVACLAALVVLLAAVAGLALRNRILLKLALRNIERRRGRTVLIVGGLMLGTAIIAAALNTGDTMTHTVRSSALTSLGHIDEVISVEGADTDSNFFVEQVSDIRYFNEELFPLVADAARDVDLIDGLTPAIMEPVAVQDVTTRQSEPRANIFAAAPDRLESFGEMKAVDGQTVTLADLRQGEVYLNTDAADELAAESGDELALFAAGKEVPLRVRAVVDYEGTGTEGSAVLMPLQTAQAILDREGQIKHILVSNRGGVLAGAEHTGQVISALEPTLGPLNLEADPTKADALDFAEELGNVFTTIFVTVGSFSIIAGILLIFLIFVMLAEERKGEMGMARAVGTKRSQLIEMFIYEGVAYDLVAAAVGAAVGLAVAYGMVFVMAIAFATFGVDIEHDFRPRSVVVAYTLGMLLTFVVVTVAAWRVSVLNIVRAIRNLPDPVMRRGTGYTWLLGVLGVALGVLLVYAGVSAEVGTPFYLGVSLAVIGTVPIMRRLGIPDRPAYTLPGVALVIWWLLPFDAFDFVLPDMSMDMTIFILSGVMVVTGATWVVMYNSDAILALVMAVLGRVRWLAASLKTAVSYPLTSRFRTGVTLAMFTLVVFTLVVMSTITNAFTNAFNDEESFGGGFDIRARTVPTSPIEDFPSALEQADGVDAQDIEVVASQSFLSLKMKQEGLDERDFESYPLRGLSEEFMASTTYEFAAIADGYETSEDVWRAMAQEPGLAVVDPLPVPRRENFGFQPSSDFRLDGFFIEDERFSPVDVRVLDEQSDTTFSVKIIGVLKDTVPAEFMLGVSTSQERLPATLGERSQFTAHFIKLAEGADAESTAQALEAAFLEKGLEADALAEELEKEVATNLAFNYILQGFMGLGLIVGVAALGVISARSVVERRQQIGVLRAIGFKRRSVQLTFLIESSFIALLGIALGTILGLVMAFNVIDDARQQASWDNMSFAVPWVNLLIIFALVYAAALLAAYFPARQASGVYPAEALRYE